ncbi:hypothetical protein EV127DRAFT_442937 [Xylaria flabelliformis]|nr:hypothetical protein EV127DRAFT_442937 [Xylaria flabelliformis]
MSDTAEMPISFLHLPSELRNDIYHQILLHQNPIDPWVRGRLRRKQELTPGLLCANKTIHRESSSLFYSMNCFDLSDATSEQVVLFFGQIGSDNAAYIRHVLIQFPEFPRLSAGHATLGKDNVRLLATIQRYCTNLTTLKTSLDSTNHMQVRLIELEIQDKLELATEALQLVDTHFRAISPLPEIIVEVYEVVVDDEMEDTDTIRQIMRSHGWTIRETQIEDCDDYDEDEEEE